MTHGLPGPPARTPERTVQRVDAVGGPNDDDLTPGVQPVHQRQKRADDAVVDLVLLAAPHLCVIYKMINPKIEEAVLLYLSPA